MPKILIDYKNRRFFEYLEVEITKLVTSIDRSLYLDEDRVEEICLANEIYNVFIDT